MQDSSDTANIEKNENGSVVHLQTNAMDTSEKDEKKLDSPRLLAIYYNIKRKRKRKEFLNKRAAYGKAKYIILVDSGF